MPKVVKSGTLTSKPSVSFLDVLNTGVKKKTSRRQRHDEDHEETTQENAQQLDNVLMRLAQTPDEEDDDRHSKITGVETLDEAFPQIDSEFVTFEDSDLEEEKFDVASSPMGSTDFAPSYRTLADAIFDKVCSQF